MLSNVTLNKIHVYIRIHYILKYKTRSLKVIWKKKNQLVSRKSSDFICIYNLAKIPKKSYYRHEFKYVLVF